MPSFRYRTYGLNIESEIECPNLLPWSAEPEVRIRLGETPDRLENPTTDTPFYQGSDDEFLLNLEGVGRFWVRGGEEIIVQPHEGSGEEEIQAYAFGSLFGVVLLQRGLLPLHASAIETDRGAVLFAGGSGFGKSTIAAEFSRRGYRLLADDVCAVSTEDGVSRLHPARPTILLRQDSLDQLELAAVGLSAAPHNPAKRIVPVERCSGMESAPIRAVYVLSPTDRADVRLSPIAGFQKIAVLAENVYRVYLLSQTQKMSGLFDELAALSASASVVSVERPSGAFLLTELADAIEQDL